LNALIPSLSGLADEVGGAEELCESVEESLALLVPEPELELFVPALPAEELLSSAKAHGKPSATGVVSDVRMASVTLAIAALLFE